MKKANYHLVMTCILTVIGTGTLYISHSGSVRREQQLGQHDKKMSAGVGPRNETQTDDPQAVLDTTSPQAIEIHWDDEGDDIADAEAAAHQSRTFEATVVNNTDDVLEVTLDALMADLSTGGGELKLPLGKRRLNPKSSTGISFPVNELPIQTSGYSTPLRIRAMYDIYTADLFSRSSHVAHNAASSGMRNVTFSSSFDVATKRTYASQRSHDNSSKALINRVLRYRDPITGTFALDETPIVSSSFISIPIDAVGGPPVRLAYPAKGGAK